jgi:hypothetical protein
VTNLSETRRQLNEELGDAALNLSGADKDNGGNAIIKISVSKSGTGSNKIFGVTAKECSAFRNVYSILE